MANCLQPSQGMLFSRRHINPFTCPNTLVDQEEFINIEILQQKVELYELEQEVNDYFTVINVINKINAGWFKTSLKIKDITIEDRLLSNMDEYEFFKGYSDYLTKVSEDFGITIQNVELEEAEYEYPEDNLNEIVMVLKVPDALESDEFVKLWQHLSQESYNFEENQSEYAKIFDNTILVLRRENSDQ